MAALTRSLRSLRPTTSVASRAIQTLSFGGTEETIIERSDYPKAKIAELFADDTVAMLGYGTQGRGQALNARDSGVAMTIGLREGGASWKLAMEDGFVPGETLFSVEEAAKRGTVIMYLLSDAGQVRAPLLRAAVDARAPTSSAHSRSPPPPHIMCATHPLLAQSVAWPTVEPHVTAGKTLYFAHGFSVIFSEDTGVVPPKDVDVILVAPKGSGTSVRSLFLEGSGINASVAVHQDVSGQARERAFALGTAVGAGYMYETTFEKEVLSDLVGERGILMGAIQGAFAAQYEVLRERGHSPSEAFNETVEEATQSLYPLIAKNGMDWMYANCSTTAQRGALDWWRPFKDATKPVFDKLYDEVANGNETRRSLDVNSKDDYKEKLEVELKELYDSEMWSAGRTVRGLRPQNSGAKST